MKVTSPEEMQSKFSKLESAINDFEKELKTNPKGRNNYFLLITGEYTREICDEIEKIYTDAGWTNVACLTSTERNMRSNCTRLQLFRNPKN